MSKGVFITGTDTDAGKTIVACGILQGIADAGYSTAAVKPVAAGCEQTPDGLRNDDALALMSAMTAQMPYAQVNPIALEAAMAPHIAAEKSGKRLDVSRLTGYCRGVLMGSHDYVVIEGAGGWRVPVNPVQTLADLAKELRLPVVLVVGLKLGCINHALLSAEAIAADGLVLAGWVANTVDPDMACLEENVDSLRRRLAAPCLGLVPRLAQADAKSVAAHLNIEALLRQLG
ncbi:MAG: dethiobiotin synthase [Pseudomonadales bacterium]